MEHPRIVVISLQRATERRASVTRQLEAQRLSFEFMDAVDKQTLPAEERTRVVAEEYILNTGRAATDGEIACFASHRKAWQMCVASGQAMVIMEDDFTLSNNFAEAINVALSLSAACGFLRFQSETRARKRELGQLHGHSVWRYTKAPHSLAGYLLSPQAADRLLSSSETFVGPADVFTKMFWLHRQPMFGITPYSVWDSDHSAASDIGARPKAQKNLLTRLRRPLRKLSHWRQRLAANRALPDPTL